MSPPFFISAITFDRRLEAHIFSTTIDTVMRTAGWVQDAGARGSGRSKRLRMFRRDVGDILLELGEDPKPCTPLAAQLARILHREVRAHDVLVFPGLSPVRWEANVVRVLETGTILPCSRMTSDGHEAIAGDPWEVGTTVLWDFVPPYRSDAKLLVQSDWAHPSPNAHLFADPWSLASVAKGLPLVLSAGSDKLEISADKAPYLLWRLDIGRVLDLDTPRPDVERWIRRLMPRHSLQEPPAKDSAAGTAFWEDWRTRTKDERASSSRGSAVPGWKVSSPGEWLLSSAECAQLARCLRTVPQGHAPSDQQRELVEKVLTVIDGAEECAVIVG